jgi:GMP synthase-like glutamine amidotransferase
MRRAADVLVFQHLQTDHPGYLFDLLRGRGLGWDTVQLEQDQPIPPLDGYRALWVMGGAMDVWQEAEHSWLRAEKAAIREAVLERKLPFLGICLGHQLLADALGGKVGPAEQHEIGVFEIALNEAGQRHPLLADLAPTAPVLQWHRAEVKQAPPGAAILASSTRCPIQAIALGERVLGLQGHVEVGAATIEEWLGWPSARAVLAELHGPEGPARLADAARAAMPRLNEVTRRLFERIVPD